MTSYALQKDEHISKRDDVLKAIHGGKHRFTELCEVTGMSKRTLAKVLSELVNDVLIIKEGEGQKIRYHLTTKAHEIFKSDISAFKDISEAYEKWHPSLTSPHEGMNFTVGSLAHYPVIQTGTIYSTSVNEENKPNDPFVANAAQIEGLIHRDIMNGIISLGMESFHSGSSNKHGKQYVAVVIDYDQLQSDWGEADRFEGAITKGDKMTLFFSSELNANINDDPIYEEMNKTGMMGRPTVVNLTRRQENALAITVYKLPAMLKMILFPKPPEDRATIMKAVGRAIDGPFLEVMNLYLRDHREFFTNSKNIPNNNFQGKVVTYLKGKGINATSTDVMEFAGILLLLGLWTAGRGEDDVSLAAVSKYVTEWGTPFTWRMKH